jgi:hypothetical protein
MRKIDPERLPVVAVVTVTSGQPTEAPPRPGADLRAGQQLGDDPGRVPLHRNERLITLLDPRELARFNSVALTGVDDCPYLQHPLAQLTRPQYSDVSRAAAAFT